MGDLLAMLGPNMQQVCISGSSAHNRMITTRVATATVRATASSSSNNTFNNNPSPSAQFDYALSYKEEEEIKMRGSSDLRQTEMPHQYHTPMSNAYNNQAVGGMSILDIDGASSVETDNAYPGEELTAVCRTIYSQYFTPEQGTAREHSLPIAAHREHILGLIESKVVSIISGFTGCGKTTQVPQYILDHYASMGKPCKIVVTQPRRIAAISIAKRVCEERRWSLGTIVGYKVGLASEYSTDTLLTYMTTGCLLEQLIKEKSLSSYTHIFVDEVHERDEETDFLLMIIRKLIVMQAANVKIVLMSATIDSEKFASYFVLPLRGIPLKAPTFQLPDRPPYPISEYYLEELRHLSHEVIPEMLFDDPRISLNMYDVAANLIATLDEVESKDTHQRRGAVLVFLPGYAEIQSMIKALDALEVAYRRKATFGSYHKWRILPLHSSITMEEQSRVFKPAGPGERKVILSTNIAESSITVSDICYVIDFCLSKQLVCDPLTDFYSLRLEWASKSSCQQRRGRVGRVGPGRVYRLVPLNFYAELRDEATPEILRCPLEKSVLRTKTFDMGEPKALLALLIDHPDLGSIQRTILTLKEVGALLITCDGVYCREDGDLTLMGRVMARLPLGVRLAKLIVLGRAFNVLEEAIIMAAGLSSKSVFSAPFSERLLAYHHKLTWSDGSFSDPFAILNAYKVWSSLKLAGDFERSSRYVFNLELDWAKRNFIQIKVMWDMQIMIDEIKYRLKSLDMEGARGQATSLDPNKKSLLLKIAMAGAFYPNFFVRGSGGRIDEMEAVRQLSNRNPCNTVMMSDFPQGQPHALCKAQIRKQLRSCATEGEEIVVHIEGSKVFVEFMGNTAPRVGSDRMGGAAQKRLCLPGRVNTAVYKAVKMRLLKENVNLLLLKPADAILYENRANRLAAEGGTQTSAYVFASDLPPPSLPRLKTEYMVAEMSHVIDPGHFFLQLKDEGSANAIRSVFDLLNDRFLESYSQPPPEGALVVAPFTEEAGGKVEWFRARILNKLSANSVLVFFIDYGNIAEVKGLELRKLPQETLSIQPLALECILTRTAPSSIQDGRGLWRPEAVTLFRKNVLEKPVFVKVYSVVQGILSVDLAPYNPASAANVSSEILWKSSIANHLKKLGFAENTPENYLSRANHELRLEWKGMSEEAMMYVEKQQFPAIYGRAQEDYERVDQAACCSKKHLKGPVSPLETKMVCVFRQGVGKEVSVEQDSVNSVLLDAQPEDPHERLIVAASVSLTGENRLIARATTILPNIHGLPALLALLFAPQMELRVDRLQTQFIGALCGLGRENDETLFPGHDLEVLFDNEIDLEDISDINRIRYWLNQVVDPLPGHEIGSFEVGGVQDKLVNLVYSLVMKERKSIAPTHWRSSFQWDSLPRDVVLSAGMIEKRSVYRIHDGVKLKIMDSDYLTALSENKECMSGLIESREQREVQCLFCEQTVRAGKSMAIHLDGRKHKDNEAKFELYMPVQ